MRFLSALLLCAVVAGSAAQAASPEAIAEARAMKVRQMQAYYQEQRRLERERELMKDGVLSDDPMLPIYWSMMMRQRFWPQMMHQLP